MLGAVLALHIAAGVVGLLLGAVVLTAPKRAGRHVVAGRAYQGAVALMTGTALALVVSDPGRLWGLGIIAVATEASALAGWVARRRHRPGWVVRHVVLMCSSYISFVTAALVVNWASPLAWVVPTLIGAPLIARTVRRVRSASGGSGPVAAVAGRAHL
ncbi:DUF2306 domain-containing protein [Nakamurella flavida]|uniref:DUF2306 domain-containing protein n=1 Tax=Nakamurella flavida TaxID=363630 RepID=A0A938YE27_9ACTN|nr:DUF2306 domain-containing protein [Nakamurella flavida]MBM9475970.1 DUF2306 domain-containing protein [Nakamurella flavida]MBM9478370.1 DUF2306 domain-containing protein [Nakamurella flavida]MDP9777741.1 putative membrane protein [Nakamurella flavida]